MEFPKRDLAVHVADGSSRAGLREEILICVPKPAAAPADEVGVVELELEVSDVMD